MEQTGSYCFVSCSIPYNARWSSGQDIALSRRNHGFDSRTSDWPAMVMDTHTSGR